MRNKKFNKFILKHFWITLVVILVLSIGGGFVAGSLGHQIFNVSQTNTDTPQTQNKIVKVQEESQTISTVEEASSSVVSIVATKDLERMRDQYYSHPFYRQFLGEELPEQPNKESPYKQEISTGTGFIVSQDGYIVTNKHVVSYEDVEYTVLLENEKKYKAEVLSRHPVYDIAVLKIDSEQELNPLKLGDSSEVKVGQKVIAIGNALGKFNNTVSTGVISGLSRSVVASSGYSQEKLANVIQTDASINPGNSGGPLLTLTGKVIGINTAMARGAQNIGFALPINDVKNMIDTVKEEGKMVMPWLGVRYVNITPDMKQANGLPVDYGALIVRGSSPEEIGIVPGSPADKADLEVNDIILKVEDEKITPKNPLNKIIGQYSPGDKIELTILHQGEEKTIPVELAKRPEGI